MSTAPRNTATEDGVEEVFAHRGFLLGSREAGERVVAQEAAGQKSFVNSDTLPSRMSPDTRRGLETAGVKFGNTVPGDELFIFVELPAGWTRQGTSHDMHSDILDEKGRKRAGVFYKAAFYDRRADLHIVRRFSVRPDYDAPDGTVAYGAYDSGQRVFECWESYEGDKYEDAYRKAEELAMKKCSDWLSQNGFPE
jgi:hypothetical protein